MRFAPFLPTFAALAIDVAGAAAAEPELCTVCASSSRLGESSSHIALHATRPNSVLARRSRLLRSDVARRATGRRCWCQTRRSRTAERSQRVARGGVWLMAGWGNTENMHGEARVVRRDTANHLHPRRSRQLVLTPRTTRHRPMRCPASGGRAPLPKTSALTLTTPLAGPRDPRDRRAAEHACAASRTSSGLHTSACPRVRDRSEDRPYTRAVSQLP